MSFHNLQIYCIQPLSNGNIATGSLDTTIKVWDPVNFKLINVFEGHTHMVTRIIELANGNLVSSSLDKTINVWNRNSGEILNTLEGFLKDVEEIQ